MSNAENIISADYKEALTSLLFQLADDDLYVLFPWFRMAWTCSSY